MPSYGDAGEENDMFFDSSDRLSFDEAEAEPSTSGLSYDIWATEPLSVGERRKNFLRQMGLSAESTADESDSDDAVSRGSSPSDAEEGSESDRFGGDELAASPIAAPAIGEECSTSEDAAGERNAPAPAPARRWWRRLAERRSETGEGDGNVKMAKKKKKCLEFTAPFIGQEFRAHKGVIWAMKFSPDGQFLATGGEDGLVRVWRVTAVNGSSGYLPARGSFCSKLTDPKFGFRRKNPVHASVVFPERVFRIEECPVHEFRGHSSDVLDLAWSKSNCILSSSKDKTVRLWQLGRDECLSVFQHNNYVTCIEFNPVDESYFISGSIDGKVRIWGLAEKRVVDWTDVRDVITAISYKPDGNGFIVGSIMGDCRSYVTSGECVELDAEIRIGSRKRTSGNKITGIKFSHENPERVMISSEDSKIRVFDGVDLTHKYKGLPKSGCQMSASFTSGKSHIVSVGDDSRVYIWNYDSSSVRSPRSVQSCEHFVHEGVSVAIPWSGPGRDRRESECRVQSHDRFSIGSWFSMDGPCRGSATWPEEKLPLWDENAPGDPANHSAWGLVIVAAGLDGTISTVHNYGLPIRL